MTTRSLRFVAAATLCALISSANAAPAAAAPAKKVINVQAAMTQECIDQAVGLKVTDVKSATKVCQCTIGIQANKLTLGEFWAIQSAAASGQNPKSIPALQRIQPALDDCHKGITLNKPQVPTAAAPKK